MLRFYIKPRRQKRLKCILAGFLPFIVYIILKIWYVAEHYNNKLATSIILHHTDMEVPIRTLYNYSIQSSTQKHTTSTDLQMLNFRRDVIVYQAQSLEHAKVSNMIKHTKLSSYQPVGIMDTKRDTNGKSQLKLFMQSNGRLGNIMFQYAVIYALAVKSGRQAVFQTFYPIRTLFPSISNKIDIELRDAGVPNECFSIHNKRGGTYSDIYEQSVTSLKTDVMLCCYFESYKYFEGFERDIKEQFRFHPILLDTVRMFIHQLKSRHHENHHDIQVVGLHVRRGDKATIDLHHWGWRVAGLSYIYRAIVYFRAKFRHKVTFVACSDDKQWLNQNIKFFDITISPFDSPEQDLALLSECDHIIMTVGTFGWWAGWLSGGEVVYYSNFVEKGSFLNNFYTIQDYFPPNWIPMCD